MCVCVCVCVVYIYITASCKMESHVVARGDESRLRDNQTDLIPYDFNK